jgi:multidrug efflux pump
VPAVAVITSLAGTIGVIQLLGLSLNNFSLMALTVASGFVVDDAIVVLENITRYVEAGMRPYDAALKGAREVGFTVISISISLVAVFIPILFASGIQGKLFAEFGITITVAVLISLVVSLITTPMLTALLSPPRQEDGNARRGRIATLIDDALARIVRQYARSLDWALANRGAVLVMLLGCVILTGIITAKTPRGIFPEQDVGVLNAGVRADQSISFDTMSEKLRQVVGIVRADPAVKNVVAFIGGPNGGVFMLVILKPVRERDSARAIIARLRPKLSRVTGISAVLNPVQDFQLGGRGSNALYQYTLKADDSAVLKDAALKLTDALKKNRKLADVDLDLNDSASEAFVTINKDAAAKLGLTSTMIDNALYDGFGQRQVANIYSGINQYHVILGVDPAFARAPDALGSVYVPVKGATSTGVSIAPKTTTLLSGLATWKVGGAPSQVNHQDAGPAATVSFNLAGSTSLGEAGAEIEQTQLALGLPAQVHGGFAGTAKAFSSNSGTILILAAFIVIYLVLGMLYENLIHPITVLSTLPSAAMGGSLALLLSGAQFDLIAIIGLLLLIGIVKKNAIMMIDFALARERERGLTALEAIREAALLRFRPILMTTLAAGFGVLPLAIGFGDGAELRRPLGIVIIGGLIASQLISLLTTPVVYVALDSLRRQRRKPRLPAPGLRPVAT